MNTDQLADKLTSAKRQLGQMGGKRRGSRKSRASRRSRSTSRKSKTPATKGGAKKRSSRRSRSTSRKATKPQRKSSRRSSRRSLSRRASNPAFAENGRINNYIKKALGVLFSVGIAKLAKKIRDPVKNNIKDPKNYVDLANKTIDAFDAYLEKHGKAKVIAEIEKWNEEARKKRMKK